MESTIARMSKFPRSSNSDRSIRPPLADITPRPIRKPEESAKYCIHCRAKQRRRFTIFGPMRKEACANLPVKPAKNSDDPRWKKLHLAWLVSPPDPADDDLWYWIIEYGECPKCNAGGMEKEYRRQFGLFRRFLILTKRALIMILDRLIPGS